MESGLKILLAINSHKVLALGGIGFINYSSTALGRTVPLYVEARGYIVDRKASPYYAIGFGANFGLRSDEFQDDFDVSPGTIFYPAFGFRIGNAENALMVDVGKKIASYNTEDVSFIDEDDKKFERFVLRIGVEL